MNKNKLLKNVKWTIITTAISAVATLLVRKVFVSSFPEEYLGLQSVIANVLIIASFFDFEIQTYCNYRIIKAFAQSKDIDQAFTTSDKLLKMAGVLTIIAGIMLSPALKLFINVEMDWRIVYTVYFMQLFSFSIQYFFMSYRLVQMATENEYIAMIITTGCTFIENIIKANIVLATKNFILFIMMEPIASLIIRMANTYVMKKRLPEIRPNKHL